MTTPHQPENGYENATDEEKTKMMLQIAKEANAEQKAMFEPEKQPWEERFAEIAKNAQYATYMAGGRFCCGGDYCNGSKEHNEWIKSFISQLLKEERECLCKDKGVIELIEEAVEAERAHIQKEIERQKISGVKKPDWSEGYNTGLSDALQVINKQE